MMVASKERLKEVCDYAYEFGDAKASEKFDLSLSTIHRYKTDYNRKPNAKILIFDIENAPLEAYVWNTKVWNTSVSHDQVKHDWYMLTWSAKWLYDNEIIHMKLTPEEAVNRDDSKLVESLWHLFDEADIIVAHNLLGFDMKMANTRFILNGLPPVRPYQTIDTLKIAQQNFKFTHNKLAYLGEIFGIGHKNPTTFELWVKCMQGDSEALQEMLDYNDQDVLLLEEVYLKLRGWAKSHPNLNLYTEDNVCSSCGSRNLKAKGYYRTAVSEYKTWQCQDCGGFSRENRNGLQSTAR